MGFEEEGIKRKAVFIEGKYHDIIVMGILRDEFLKSMEGAELK